MKATGRRARGTGGLLLPGLVFGWLTMVAPGLQAQQVSWTGALSYSGGSYVFDTRSNNFTLSTGLRVGMGPVSLGLSAPLVVYDGGLVTTMADGLPLPTGGQQGEAVRDRNPGQIIGTKGRGAGQGPSEPEPPVVADTVVFQQGYDTTLGDPYMSAEGELWRGFGVLRSLTVTAGAKIPLTDPATGVGSGAWDWTVGASAMVAAGGVTVLADVAWWWLGDMPDLEIRDGPSWAAGAALPVFSGKGSLMALVTGMSRAIETMDAPIAVTASLGRALGDRAFGTVAVGTGLTESAPDFYVSLGWSVRLTDR